MPERWLLNEHLIPRIFCEYPSIQLCTITGTGMSQVMPMKGMSVNKLVAWGQLNMRYQCSCSHIRGSFNRGPEWTERYVSSASLSFIHWSKDTPNSDNSDCWLTYWSHTTATAHRSIDFNFGTTVCNILCNSSALTVVSVEKNAPASSHSVNHKLQSLFSWLWSNYSKVSQINITYLIDI